jgi:glycosyltransferase involved in cell wall biosynthesis
MRIAIVAPPWVPVPPPAYGGTEAVLDTLSRGLVAAGHEVLLATTGDAACPVPRTWEFDSALGVGVGRPLDELRHVIHAYDRLLDQHCDVVHDHTLVGPVYAARFPALPVVTTNHGPFNDDLMPFFAAIADRVPIIAISHHQASTAGDVPVAAVVHHGIDVDTSPIGDGSGGFAAFVGRMCPEKGVDAAARLARRAGIPLLIAAKMNEPLEQAYFEAEVAPLLGGDIEYVGELGRDDTARLVGAATCLLNPIRWAEPFGMVMLEALAVGTPVVTTPLGAAPEIVDDGVTGFLRADDDGLVDCLGQGGDLDRSRCRAVATERFSAARMVEAHLEVYDRIATRSALVA